jgi:hypothetical protein
VADADVGGAGTAGGAQSDIAQSDGVLSDEDWENGAIDETMLPDGSSTFRRELPDGSIVNVEYARDRENGTVAIVAYSDGSNYIYRYKGEMAEAAIKKFSKYAVPDSYEEGSPGEDDITEDIALSKAVDAIKSKYALTQETLDRFEVTPVFYSKYEDVPGNVWFVYLYPFDKDEYTEIGCYSALLNASTGDVLKMMSAADGKG